MTTRDRIRRLAEVLPDVLPDAELGTAERILEALAGGLDPAARAALFAPDDDEPATAADRAALAARADADPDAYVPLDVALAQLDAAEAADTPPDAAGR